MKLVWLLILLHLLVSMVCGLLIFSRRLPLPRMVAAVVLLMPPAGFAIFLVVWAQSTKRRGRRGRKIGVEKLKVNNEMYQNIFYGQNENAQSTVPLEEALLLNDTKTKRTLMMDVLNDDPEQYIGLLEAARNDTDTEVSHYATTAMTELQKNYDLRLQKCEQAYAAAPADQAVLRQYLNCLKNYLDTNLLDGALRAMYQNTYLQMLEQYAKLFDGSVGVLREIFQEQINLKNYSAAEDTVERAICAWPHAAESLLMQLQLNVTINNSGGVRQTLRQLQDKQVYIPKKDRATVEFWNHEKA